MIRSINTYRLLFNILRPTYALDRQPSPQLNAVYRFLLACLSPLIPALGKYEEWGRKYYALASNDASSISVKAYLNYYYGIYGEILVEQTPVFGEFVNHYSSDMGTGTLVNHYSTNMQTAYAVYRYGSIANTPTVVIPSELRSDSGMFNDFISDLNALILFGLQYAITIRG